MSKEINNSLNEDFKVNMATGEAYASQRVVSELAGVNQSTISRHFASQNCNVEHGVTSEMLQRCITHFAIKGKPEAIQTLAKLAKAGAKAYIYHKAGVPLVVEQTKAIVSDDVELKKLEIKLEMLKITEQTKQLEIEAKIKLGRKKTGVRRLKDIDGNYVTMKTIVREFEDHGTPIAVSALTAILYHYAPSIRMKANCIHKSDFMNVLNNVLDFAEEDGAYWLDRQSGIRFKADWLE